MIDEMRSAWLSFNESKARCAIVTGSGGRAFSAGIDMREPPVDPWRAFPGFGVSVAKPVIAAVDGYCLGGGYVLAQSCDLIVATRQSTFQFPEARLGAFGGMGATVGTRVPAKIAAEFLMLGEPMSAERAYAVGMINEVVDASGHLTRAWEIAGLLADRDLDVLCAIKQLLAEQHRSQIDVFFDVRRTLHGVSGGDRLARAVANFSGHIAKEEE